MEGVEYDREEARGESIVSRREGGRARWINREDISTFDQIHRWPFEDGVTKQRQGASEVNCCRTFFRVVRFFSRSHEQVRVHDPIHTSGTGTDLTNPVTDRRHSDVPALRITFCGDPAQPRSQSRNIEWESLEELCLELKSRWPVVNHLVARVSFFYFDWWLWGGGIIHPTFRSQAPAPTIQKLCLSLLHSVPGNWRPDAGSHAIMFR